MALLFSLFSLYPRLGYNGEATVRIVKTSYQLLYRDVEVKCNITYNPLLFPFSWLINRGQSSYHFVMRTAPMGVGEFGITWSSLEEVKEDALLVVTLNELFINIPFLLFAFLAIELMNLRSLYLGFFGGIIGFSIAGLLGAIIGFLLISFIALLLVRKLEIKSLVEVVDLLWKRNK